MFLDNIHDRIKNKIIPHLEGKNASVWLFIIAFTESSFFPIPPDLFLIPVVTKSPNRWKWFASVVAVGSVLGALFGYLLGFLFFDFVGTHLVSAYGLEDKVVHIGELFDKNAFWAMFTSAFTPIPYKLFAIAGGLFHVNLFIFVVASLLGRGLRFFAVGYLSKVFGERMGEVVFKHFNLFTLAFGLVVVIYAMIQFI